MRFCDELEVGFGWIVDDERMERTSHVLDGWLIDPVAWEPALERVDRPLGVIPLLDRHNRDCAELATRLGVPHSSVPFQGVEGTPFEFLRVARSRWWREVALWWPQRRVLVCADALGTVEYFRAQGEPLGVHPLLRLRPPKQLSLVWPDHVLCGHGEGVHEAASDALHQALRTARRRLPAVLRATIRS